MADAARRARRCPAAGPCGCAGRADLRYAACARCRSSGTRAATAYGSHVCGGDGRRAGRAGLDGGLRRRVRHRRLRAPWRAGRRGGSRSPSWPAGSTTPYPLGHHELFQAIAAQGVAGQRVAAGPAADQARVPGPQPGDRGAEPGHRGGRGRAAQRRAEHRPACPRSVPAADGGARPGDLRASAGCHEIIRDWGAVCVTGARDVLEHLAFPGDDLPARARGPVLPRDALDPVSRKVLEAVPARDRARPGPHRRVSRGGLRHGPALPGRARGGRFRRALRPWLAPPEAGLTSGAMPAPGFRPVLYSTMCCTALDI